MSPSSRLVIVALVAGAIGIGVGIGIDRQVLGPAPAPPAPALPKSVAFVATTFAALSGWDSDRISDALPAVRASCARFADKAPDEIIGSDDISRPARAWQQACAGIMAAAGEADLRQRLSRLFVPYAVMVPKPRSADAEGKFTGYFEADLRGSLTRHGPYQAPIYGLPRDLVTVDLKQFVADLSPALPQKLVGHVEGNALEPYYTRQQIDRDQALAGRADVIAWSDDPIAVHILHIQGSGRMTLDDGQILHLGFAGHNGRAFRGIGSILLAAGVLQRGEANMDRVRTWLREHPADAARYMDENARYIFFQVNPSGDASSEDTPSEDKGPVGSLGVPLTPGRSLAVDPSFIPLGGLLWLETTAPGGTPIQRLVAAQDTGAAITGPVRGDLFWGHGEDAFAMAARMNSPGRYYVLVPAP